jgi:RNA polymerase sigma-70 factor (ECF subfamily)
MVIPADSRLVRQAQSGDTGAFELLYRQCVGRVYAVCIRISADRSHAEELTQETFIRAWEMLKTFRGESAFSTWVHRIAVNTALAALRSRTRRSMREEPSDEPEQYHDRAIAQDSAHLGFDIEKAIAALPPQARAVFTLHDIEGYKHAEIAEQLGVTVGTCKAQLHRARRLMKEVLGR